MVKILIGSPIDDKEVVANEQHTVEQIFKENGVSTSGTIQHNGRKLSTAQTRVPIKDLNVLENDTIYVVRKMDGAA